jgi:hypothetical protein
LVESIEPAKWALKNAVPTAKEPVPPRTAVGYSSQLEALADPDHEEHDEYVEWACEDFDPETFDLASIWNARRKPNALSPCQRKRPGEPSSYMRLGSRQPGMVNNSVARLMPCDMFSQRLQWQSDRGAGGHGQPAVPRPTMFRRFPTESESLPIRSLDELDDRTARISSPIRR